MDFFIFFSETASQHKVDSVEMKTYLLGRRHELSTVWKQGLEMLV